METTDDTSNFVPHTALTGHPGQPRHAVNCLSVGMTGQRSVLGFGHRQILWVEPLLTKSNQVLDGPVTEKLNMNPNADGTYILRSQSVRIQHWWVSLDGR